MGSIIAHELDVAFFGLDSVYDWTTMLDYSSGYDAVTNNALTAAGRSFPPVPEFNTPWNRDSPDCFLIHHADDDTVNVQQTRNAVQKCHDLGIHVRHQEPTATVDVEHFPVESMNMDSIRDWFDRLKT